MSHVTTPVLGSARCSPTVNDGCQASSNDWNIDQTADSMDFDFLTEYLLEDSSTGGGTVPFDINPSTASQEQIVKGGVRGPSHHRKMQVVSAQSDIMQPNVHIQAHEVPQAAPIAVHTSVASAMLSQENNGLVASTTPQTFGTNSDCNAHEPTKRQRTDNTSASVRVHLPHVVCQAHLPLDTTSGRSRKKTQAQIDRRRERNRILARRTRLRKKFFFESLQKEAVDLQRENAALKDIVRSKLDENGTKILEQCSAAERLPDAVLEACGDHSSDIGQQDFNLVRSIQQSQHSFVITDPSLEDNPIVFASDDFLNLTGYSREEVLGRNCRFLQGVDTSASKVQAIRKGLSVGSDMSVTMLNYTSDGTPFWNKLFIAALRDAQDNIVNFIGVLVKVESPEPDDAEHDKCLPSMHAAN